jgi:hypothetical protein
VQIAVTASADSPPRGKRMPSLLVIKKLAGALETTMASLMMELEHEEG